MSDWRPDGQSAASGPIVLLRRIGWGSVFAVAALLLQSLFHPAIGPVTIGLAVALVALTAFAPFNGLLVTASLGPLSSVLFVLTSASPVGVEFTEALTLAFIAGWAGRRTILAAPLAVTPIVRWTSVLLLAAAAASGVANWAVIRMELLGEPLSDLIKTFIARDYLLHLAGSAPVTATALACECVLLLLIVADTVVGDEGRRDGVLAAMVVGAAAAASLNVLRLVNATLAHQGGWLDFLQYFRTWRVNVQYGDLNAAGSYFALTLPIALGLLARRRALALICSPMIGAALWVSGSRVALAAVCAALAAGILVALRGRQRRIVPVLAGLLLLGSMAGALWSFYPKDRNAAVDVALNVRVELAKVGLEMVARNPLFGVGLGRYYTESESYLQSKPIAGVGIRENAHNYFIQILAELGVPGLLLFLALTAASLVQLWGSAKPLPVTSIGLLAGLIAFLLSCLAGHALIIPEASYPFWMALGLAAAPLDVAGSQVARRALRLAGSIGILMLAVTLPYRMAEAQRTADMSGVSIGLSPHWQRDPDGTRFRWAGGRSTFFVASSAKAVAIPLRNTGHGDLEVSVLLDGREVDRILLPADGQWRVKRLTAIRGDARFSRIDLAVYSPESSDPLQASATDEGGAISVGRPALQQ